MTKEKRIPTILGILVLFMGVIAGVVLTSQKTFLGSKASNQCKPINPQVTNITHNSADISFVTNQSCLAYLNVDNRTITDIRFLNTNTQAQASRVHYFQVNNLKESNPYTYYLIADGHEYKYDNYVFQTAKKPPGIIPTSNLAWGRVFTPDLKAASDAIIYLNIPGAAPLSSFITSKGYWNISLATSFNSAKNNWFTPPENIEEEIIVISQDQSATQITSNTSRNNPVPDIILGQNSFSDKPVASLESGSVGSVSQGTGGQKLNIVNPQENETINTDRPDFFGTAPVNSKITIKVESNPVFDGQTVSSSQGTWNWSPPQNLSPGEHTITVEAENPQTGLKEVIKRKFIVLAQDNNLSFSSTPSANLASPTVIPTVIPTLKTASTPTPTLKPTTIPTVQATATTIASTSSIPKTATAWPTLILISVASILLITSVTFKNQD